MSTVQHAVCSPSSAHRWLACPGSIRAIRETGVIEEPSEAATIGTAKHEWLSKVLEGLNVSDVPDEFRASVEIAYKAIMAELCPDAFIVSEIMLPIGNTLPGIQQEAAALLFGTADAVIFDGAAQTLWVIDAKFGRIKVDVENNPQLTLYMLGAIDWAKNAGVFEYIKHFKLGIIQPEVSPELSVFTCAKMDIEAFALNVVKVLHEINDNQNSATIAAGKHCKWCPAKLSCAARNRALVEALPKPCAQELAAFVDAGVPLPPEPPELKSLEEAYDFSKQVVAWADQVAEAFKAKLAKGDIGRYTLGRIRAGAQVWNDADPSELAAELGVSVEDLMERRSPAAVAKAFKISLDAYVTRKPDVMGIVQN